MLTKWFRHSRLFTGKQGLKTWYLQVLKRCRRLLSLEQANYIASMEIATVLFLALPTNKPVLIEGPAGVGKTELANLLYSLHECFARVKSKDLNHKTTLIILGDGRSNYLNPQAGILAQMREHCRRIIWLTPEKANTWTTGDSEITTYKTHCHEIRTMMNLNHLTQFIQELVL